MAAVDRYLGLTEARRQKLIEAACDALRDGVSVRKFADVHGISKSQAGRLFITSRSVLKELGEL